MSREKCWWFCPPDLPLFSFRKPRPEGCSTNSVFYLLIPILSFFLPFKSRKIFSHCFSYVNFLLLPSFCLYILVLCLSKKNCTWASRKTKAKQNRTPGRNKTKQKPLHLKAFKRLKMNSCHQHLGIGCLERKTAFTPCVHSHSPSRCLPLVYFSSCFT